LGQRSPLQQLLEPAGHCLSESCSAFGVYLKDDIAGFRTIYLAGLRAIGRQRTSVEVAALRRLGIGRRTASMAMLHRRDAASPTAPTDPVPRNPLNQEK
jgi:hypothetical protein